MKVINSRGRILLEVTRHYRQHVNTDSLFDYVEPGHGGGYGVTLVQLIHNIDSLKMDYPSARVEGLFPACDTLLCDCMARDVPCPPLRN